MLIVVSGLIVNTASFSDLVFADKSDVVKEAKEKSKEKAKEEREKAKEKAKEEREKAKEKAKGEREKAKEKAKGEREDIKKFRDGLEVTSSSTTNTEKSTICHIPPGNPAKAHTITVGSPAVSAHKAHGDYTLGSCEDDEFNPDNSEFKKESRFFEGSDNESKTSERAQRLIEKLEQQISNLEKRLQNILDKYESGEYYGNISTTDSITKSYVISFDGIASSIFDESVTTEMSGELFMENQVTTLDTSKFKIRAGELIIGNTLYDVVFGKARLSSSGPTGQEDSLVIVLQTIDSEDNYNTIKITLGFNSPLEGGFGSSAEKFEILENSKVSGQWILDGNGESALEA
ncbi:MAG: hypothetical protein OEQ12_05205 [Nitrosopumilus sp.]|nr:hypothetical protein [Nitrosopumilus sp.]